MSLQDVPGNATLEFAVGLAPTAKPGTVRFELILEPKSGKPEVLYRKELSEPGWVEERIPLGSRQLDGAQLVFRRTLVSGPLGPLLNSFWANPMIRPPEPETRPSVVLISLDTLRADRLGAYGYAKANTPSLDRLAREGVRYENAYSPSTWTVPSHASMLYGLHLPDCPAALRSHDPKQIAASVPDRPVAEIFRKAGYLTAGFTGGGYLAYPFDFPRGFDTYYGFEQPKGTPGACEANRFDGPEVFRRAEEWLRANHSSPFFLFLHTYDVHDRCPFIPPKAGPFTAWPTLSPARQRELLAYYDELITKTDRRLGDFLRTLDQLGRAKDTLVIVTSDHGDAFDEHGQRSHGCPNRPYEELVRVPLIARWPGRIPQGRRVSTPVSVIDIVPTVLALMGLPEEPWMQGQLLPDLGLPAAPARRPVYVHCGDLLAVRQDSNKLITSRSGAFPDELYDLQRDPWERHNLASERPPVYEELQRAAAGYWQAVTFDTNAPPKPPELDEAARERLRALGYLE